MMLEESGTNTFGHKFWKLLVHKDHCKEGLEVMIITDDRGIRIGGELLTWGDLKKAKESARKYDHTI